MLYNLESNNKWSDIKNYTQIVNNNKRIIVLCLLILLIIVIFVQFINNFFNMPYYIIFYSVKEDRVIKEVRVKPGDRFTLSYIHSYNKTPVYETFLVTKKGEIILKETEYSWQGAGLQDTYPIRGIWGYKDGNVYISEINTILMEIPLRVGIMANHKFIYNDKIIPLSLIAEGGELIIIKVNRHW